MMHCDNSGIQNNPVSMCLLLQHFVFVAAIVHNIDFGDQID